MIALNACLLRFSLVFLMKMELDKEDVNIHV